MPTVFEIFGLRFFFFSDEHTPIHVHVEKNGNSAKIEIMPNVKLIYNRGLKKQEIKQSIKLAELFKDEIIKTWNEYFDE